MVGILLRSALLLAALVFSACAGDNEATSVTARCLLNDEERVEIAQAVSTAVEADPTLQKFQTFLALHGDALAHQPPKDVAWGFRYEYGAWVSDPAITQANQRLIFDDHWELRGVADAGYGEADVRLVFDGTSLFSFRRTGDMADVYDIQFSASGWSESTHGYEGGICMYAGTFSYRTPGANLTHEWCDSRDETTTFEVRTLGLNFKAELTGPSSAGGDQPTTAVVNYQGQTRRATQTSACPRFADEVSAFQPSYQRLFAIESLTGAMSFWGPP